MKKFIPGLLAMLLCLGVATSCDKNKDSSSDSAPTSTESTTPSTGSHEQDLTDVKDYLTLEMNSVKLNTRKNFKVSNSFSFYNETAKYAITWSVNVDGITITKGDKKDTVKMGEFTEDTPYVLTATITDPDGCHSVSVDFNGTALKAADVIPSAITAKPVESTSYKLYVYQANKKADCYFMGEMSGYYFKTSEDYTEGVDVYVENISSDNFYLYFENTDGKQYIGVQVSSDGAHNNIVFSTTPTSSFYWNAELGTVCTHLDVSKTGEPADFYLGNYSTHMTISASTLDNAPTSHVGGLVEMISKDEIGDDVKVAEVKEALNVSTKHTLDKTVELPISDDRYANATIAWASNSQYVTINGAEMAITIPAETTTVKLTATITVGTASDTKEFDVVLGPKTEAVADKTNVEAVVVAAYNLAAGETLPGDDYTLTGKITKVNTAWNADYNNITVTITVNDKSFECYRLKSGAADASTLKVGDTITVTGEIMNYNGKVEFGAGCELDAIAGSDVGGGDVGGGDTTVDSGTYSYTFPAKTFSENGTQDLGGVNWTVEGNGGYFGWDTNNGKGQQFGSSKAPCTELTVTSESFSNVSKITINTAGTKDIAATCDVYVGETKVGTITLAMTAQDYSFDVEGLTGAVKFVYTQTSSKAIYIKSITVECAE